MSPAPPFKAFIRLLLPLAALGLGLIACGEGAEPGSATVGDGSHLRALRVNEIAAASVAPGSRDESVDEMLSDGKVTSVEYHQAVRNTMACLDARGIPHTEPVYEDDASGIPLWTYSVGPVPEHRVEQDQSAYDNCWLIFDADVQSSWVSQHGAPKEVQDEQGALECAAEQGVEVATIDDLLDAWRSGLRDTAPGIRTCLDIAFGN